MSAPTPSSPRVAAVARAFLTPRANPAGRVPLELPGARRIVVDTPEGRLAAVDAGHGLAVLLVHGWEGQASDLGAVATALLAAGARVIAIDLPAHGDSGGEQTSIPASARALLALQRQLGELHAVVGHSVGSAVAVEAMAHGLAVRRAAFAAAPARYRDYALAFAAQAGLDAAQRGELIALLLRQGIDLAAVSLPARAARLQQPALFVHSADDRVVPIADAVASSRAWAGARLHRVDGLGHRRLLQDAATVQEIVSFVLAAPDAAVTPQPRSTSVAA